ncbi:MAG: GNAT family N-acetyltransferase [Pseudomonadota bacterium]
MAKTLSFRDARADDVATLVKLLSDDPVGRTRESDAPQDATTYHAAFAAIDGDPNSRLIVATQGDCVIGFLQITVIPGLSYRGTRRALIEDVRVAAGHRGHGIGAALMRHAEALAHADGCGLVELFAHEDRTAAHRFYEAQGYAASHRGFRKRLG